MDRPKGIIITEAKQITINTKNMHISQLLDKFSEETTLHGESKISNKKNLCYKMIWSSFLVTMLILTTYFISKSVKDFFHYKTMANIELIQKTCSGISCCYHV